jgi:hypothetical protein
MKNTLTLLCLVLTVLTNGCAFGQMPTHPWTATIKVVGEDGTPMVGADVSVSYTLPATPTQDPGSENWGEVKGLTDVDGIFSASHTDSSWGLGINVEKAGYYTTHIGHQLYVPGQFDDKTVAANRNPTITLVLKKIGKFTAMYAKSITYIKFPEDNKPIAYDLVAGDWVAPYGKGINADIFFEKDPIGIKANDIGSKIIVSFPNKNDGIQIFNSSEEEKGSALRSPHEAPLDGYQSEWIRDPKEYDENRIYLFRVKTKVDDNGNIVSAHYGKIYGDFMQFRYYLNPTPNDRNIEFDPKQNLLHGLKSFEQVTAP